MSKLVCKDLSVKYFGYDEAISGITTDFSDGLNVIFAPEKSGKTTLLKAIAGILTYKGEVTLDGEDVSTISLKDRDFQMLFDDYALFSRRSARYNLEYPLKLRKVPKTERKRAVEEAAALFDLDVMIDAPVYRLNEWHKVCIVLCRAYLRKAKVLLIDNIFSKLDPQSRKEACYRFMPLFFDRGIVIYATDLVEEAAALSREIKLLSYGYLLQEGSAEDFCNHPACLIAFVSFGEYVSTVYGSPTERGITLFDKEFTVGALSLISDEYFGKDVIFGFSLGDLVFSKQGIPAEVLGRFCYNEKFVYLVQIENQRVFVLSDDDISFGSKAFLAVKSVSAVFDSLNQRTILRS